jgi:basic amino acid/polyamine antiporter, APA family
VKEVTKMPDSGTERPIIDRPAGPSIDGAAAGAEKPTLFLRKASGVVKAFSPFDAYAYNTLALNCVYLGAIAFLTAAWAMPGGNMALAVVLTAILTAFMGVVYAYLQASFPRTGGDYVFQSRILSGGVGFVFPFSVWVIGGMVWSGTLGWGIANLCFGPGFSLLGAYTGNSTLTDIGTWCTSSWGMFILGAVFLGWATFICSVGFRTYAIVQRYFFWVGLVASLGFLAYIASISHASFITNFNAVMSDSFNVKDAYATTIANAKAAGFNHVTTFSWAATFAMMPAMWFFFAPAVYSSGNQGEIRDSGTVRAKIWQILGAIATATVIMVAFAYLIVDRFGGEFLSSSTWLWANAGDQYPLPMSPFFGFFGAAMSTSVWLVVLMMLTFTVWQTMSLPNNQVMASRVLLAMSIDRAGPKFLGKVNTHTHTPLNAVLLIGAGGLVVDALYSFTDWFWRLTLSIGLLMLLTYMASAVALLLWPKVKPDSYRSSPAAKGKFLGLPIPAVCAVIFLIGGIYITWRYLVFKPLGAADTVGYLFIGGSLVFAVILYYAFKWYRKDRESLDLSLVYKEIPPE